MTTATRNRPRVSRNGRHPEPKRAYYSEEVIVYDSEELGGKIWKAKLPMDELIEHLPDECRWMPDYSYMRKVVAGFGVGLGVMLAFCGTVPAMGLATGIILALMLGIAPGGFIGWILGPTVAARMGYRPFWTIRRLVDPATRLTEVVPLKHTLGRGVPVEVWQAEIDSLLEKQLQEILRAQSEQEEEEGEGMEYVPNLVHRGSTLWEDLQMRDETDDLKAPQSRMEKLQIGVMAVMALSSIGLLIFVAIATTPAGG